MDQDLIVNYETIARFLEASDGNYRNALYINCCSCKYTQNELCKDFLFIPGHNCKPILLPLSDTKKFFTVSVDKTDCAGVMTNQTFCRLYRMWLNLNTDSDEFCPLHQIINGI